MLNYQRVAKNSKKCGKKTHWVGLVVIYIFEYVEFNGWFPTVWNPIFDGWDFVPVN